MRVRRWSADAGGLGKARGTFALVPEIADEIARRNSKAPLCAAVGITHGRGLAAALMLGADGAVIGTRFWVSRESLVHPRILDRALAATGTTQSARGWWTWSAASKGPAATTTVFCATRLSRNGKAARAPCGRMRV
ncbi:nitronate monooxygenase [Leisingera sp.]|uniref:nitronate monooxygenase n=1 Tax=Leisingera sp. TaxID=1879318 RepID=UPI002B270B6A|nr:nitronate monooxygenase [Leisingera sp.]